MAPRDADTTKQFAKEEKKKKTHLDRRCGEDHEERKEATGGERIRHGG